MDLLTHLSAYGLPETVALGAVAVIGYLFGRSGKSVEHAEPTAKELVRAAGIARQLESVAAALRGDLASHLAEVERFKRAVYSANEADAATPLENLREEAERVLEPTLRLVAQMASAYDRIRQQSQALAGFSGGRTDPVTGLCNSRALSELLRLELASHEATGGQFSLAIVGLHAPAGREDTREARQARLLQASDLLQPQLRDTDMMARYGIDELVVVMPHTRLYGGSVFGRRARLVLSKAGLVASCGLAQSMSGDEPAGLLGRADSALYSAKAAGAGAQFLHNGAAIRPDATGADPPPSEPVACDDPQRDEVLATTAV